MYRNLKYYFQILKEKNTIFEMNFGKNNQCIDNEINFLSFRKSNSGLEYHLRKSVS